MPEIVLVVEGHGDVEALPPVVGKVGAWLGSPLFASKPIRCGGWGRVKKAGGLEKWVGLAASRAGCTKVVVVIDLDDGCPVDERGTIQARVDALEAALGVKIEICFCLREFEAWFLAVLDHIVAARPEYDWTSQEPFQNAAAYRDAKGKLQDCMNEEYGEAADQVILARAIPPDLLFTRDRSFRRFVKAVSGLDYDTLAAA